MAQSIDGWPYYPVTEDEGDGEGAWWSLPVVTMYFLVGMGWAALGAPPWVALLEGVRFMFGTAVFLHALDEGLDLNGWTLPPATAESHSEPDPPTMEAPMEEAMPCCCRYADCSRCPGPTPRVLVARAVEGVLALVRAVDSPRGRHLVVWVLLLLAWWVWVSRDSGLALVAFFALAFISVLLD